jgi:DNA-binding response OmpR family regulator
VGAQKHILVVDGDPDWRKRVVESLEGPQIEVKALAGGGEAFESAGREKPDVVVTEFVLPDLSGPGLCRLIREDAALQHVGLVMVTSHASEIDRILAFEAGIDDFLAKPFFGRELASRVGAVLRRASLQRGVPDVAAMPSQGLVHLHAATSTILVAERRLDLTPREFQILSALIRPVGRVLTRKQLILRVWGTESEHTDRVVDAHIKSIRRKLAEAKGCIETVRGVGYRFSDVN